MRALILALLVTAAAAPLKYHDCYSEAGAYNVWAEPGLHLIMSDNATPDDYSDDWVIDYEDNRIVEVAVLDE